MKHHRALLTTLLLATLITATLNSQTDLRKIREATNASEMTRRSALASQEFARKKAEAVLFAKARNLPLVIDTDEYYAELMYIDDAGVPVYYKTNNIIAAQTTNTNELHNGGSLGLNLEGSGFIIGEWDGGAVLGTHEQLSGRVTQIDAPANTDDHATHVAGTLIGDGTGVGAGATSAKGMAPQAMLNAWDFSDVVAELQSASAQDLLVSNHSYGPAAGWTYNSTAPATWQWHGGTANLTVGGEDPTFGSYNASSQAYDQLANLAPYHLLCFSAGNHRVDQPTAGHLCKDIQAGTTFNYNSAMHPGADGPSNSNTSFTLAKNVLSVGAVNDLPNYAGPGSVVMTTFSSWGPTDDGRIKPDLVANGFEVYSSSDAGNDQYNFSSGTSMSTPNAAGSLLLLQEHYENLNGSGKFMRAATLKAVAIHTAAEAGPAPGPDYQYGWGLLDVRDAAKVISHDALFDQTILEGTIANGETKTYHIQVADTNFWATLAWSDPAGAATPAGTLNSPAIKLVNDLDLRVTVDATNVTTMPYVLNPANPGNAATTGDNFRDNVEQVKIAPPAGLAVTVTVTHKGVLNAPQNFSLIMSTIDEYCGVATFTGSGIGIGADWNNHNNWDLGVVPTLCNDVVIPATAGDAFVRMGKDAFAKSVIVAAGGYLGSEENATLTISGSAGSGLVYGGNGFHIGTIMIDSTVGSGLHVLSSGILSLRGNIDIGQSIGKIGVHGLVNEGSFSSIPGSTITIDGMPGAGILNSGTDVYFTNSSIITLGQSDVGWHCLLNNLEANFLNFSGGTIKADNTLNSGVVNEASFTNDGTIEIGQSGTIAHHGISNTGIFVHNDGSIHIDRTGFHGINNLSDSLFQNSSTIEIGQTAGISRDGVHNTGRWTNAAGSELLIDFTTGSGLYTKGNSSFFNAGTMKIGENYAIGNHGIFFEADVPLFGFTFNAAGGIIQVDQVGTEGIYLKHSAGGDIFNYGLIEVGLHGGSIGSTGFVLDGTTLWNEGDIKIKDTGGAGMEIKENSLLYHASYGQTRRSTATTEVIQIDHTSGNGITLDGYMANGAMIQIGQNGGNIGGVGLYNDGGEIEDFPGALFTIDHTSSHGYQSTAGGSFTLFYGNDELQIGKIGPIGGTGLHNSDLIFNNGKISIYGTAGDGIYNTETGTITNSSEIHIGNDSVPARYVQETGLYNQGIVTNRVGATMFIFSQGDPLFVDFPSVPTAVFDMKLGSVLEVGN